MKPVIRFLREVRLHNERTWFQAHKEQYLEVKALFEEFTDRLIEGIASFDPSVGGLSVQDCTYRIYRDTRFSADKSPYKTHMGAYVAPHGKKSGYAGYYFHVEPDNHLLSAGLYCPHPTVLRSVREEIVDHGAEIVREIGQAEGFAMNREQMLKRMPAGFAEGIPGDELLRLKNLFLERPLDERFLTGSNLPERTVELFRSTYPFVERINRAVRYAYEEMM